LTFPNLTLKVVLSPSTTTSDTCTRGSQLWISKHVHAHQASAHQAFASISGLCARLSACTCMRTVNAHTAQCCRAGALHPRLSPPHRYYSTVRLVAQHLVQKQRGLAGAPVAAGRARTPSSRRRRADTMEALARPSAVGGRAAAASCLAAAVPRRSPPSSAHTTAQERSCNRRVVFVGQHTSPST
jgi:hypothetical protein